MWNYRILKVIFHLLVCVSLLGHDTTGVPTGLHNDPNLAEIKVQLNDVLPLERNPENIDGPNLGPDLYSIDILKPTCLAHGALRDTKENQTQRPMAPYVSYNDWIKKAVDLHNVFREILGYKPVILSDNLTRISQAYAQAMHNPEGVENLEFEESLSNRTESNSDKPATLSSYMELDLLFEEVYLSDNVAFEAPDTFDFLTIACCPGPFTQEFSPDAEEIGIARFVQEAMGNYRRIVVVAAFYPKSTRWRATELCQATKNDSMETDTESYEDEAAGYQNTENSMFGDFDIQSDPDEDSEDAEEDVRY